MLSVLFVDDEQSLLEGLRRGFRTMRREWTMLFAGSGIEALALMSEQRVDVIVSDMRMPGMSGLELLRQVRDDFPATARIVLSGQTELQETLKSASLAQVFLHKPCEPELVKQAIQRTSALIDELSNVAVRRVVGSIDTLPSPPYVVTELNRCLLAEDTDLAEVERIVMTDPAVTAKMLQLANSAVFGLVQDVTSVKSAITFLGIATVRDLAVAATLYRDASTSRVATESLDDIEAHGAIATRVAAALCGDQRLSSTASTAIVLYDIGKLLIAIGLPQQDQLISDRQKSGEHRIDVELELLGITHAGIGASLLRLWGIPHEIVETAAWHHNVPPVELWQMDTLNLVYLTEAVIQHGRTVTDVLPDGYLAAVGCEVALAVLEPT